MPKYTIKQVENEKNILKSYAKSAKNDRTKNEEKIKKTKKYLALKTKYDIKIRCK